MSKVDDGILQLKVETLTESLLKCTQDLSNLQSKYHKEIFDLKPDLDQKNAEVLFIIYLINSKNLLTLSKF